MKIDKRIQIVQNCLDAYGEAVRADWNYFDGRENQEILQEISGFLNTENPVLDFEEWLKKRGIQETDYGYEWK